MTPGRYLKVATEAAMRGGRAVMEEYGRETIRTKDDDSPVTSADLKSNEAIKTVLAETPLPVLSEEDDDERDGSGRIWIVDPLDGTSDFVDRTGEFTVMVALVSDGVPVIGAINRPATGATYAAERGGGAWRSDGGAWARIRVDGAAPADCIALRSRHHYTEAERLFLESLGLAEIRALGSSLKAARISEGGAHVYATFTDRMKEWDTAASWCIIHEAGGRMTDMAGAPLTYNRPDVFHRNGILATNGSIHDYIVSRYSTAGSGTSESRSLGRR